MLLAWLSTQSARVAAAQATLGEALALAIAVNAPALQADGVLGFVEVLESQGEAACARRVLQFIVDHPSTDAAERIALGHELARRAAPAQPYPAWPGLTLPELLHRVVVETRAAYAPLLRELRPPA